jgi:SulP family sulfate permease
LLIGTWHERHGWRTSSAKAGPVLAVAVTTLLAWGLDLGAQGVKLVGDVPQGLPPLTLPSFSMPTSVDQPDRVRSADLDHRLCRVRVCCANACREETPAHQAGPGTDRAGRGQYRRSVQWRLPGDRWLCRSVVNFDAGAETPAAGAFTAVGLAIASLALTPLIAYLPIATLAATIIVAVLSLVDFSILKKTWAYSRADFAAVAITILATLLLGVEIGVSAGVVLSVLIHLYKSSRPHVAEVGQVPGTEHFRNVLRHKVITDDRILTLRVDESLYFANARFLEDYVYDAIAKRPQLKHVILMCPAINAIDMSALESLESINERLKSSGVTFHLSEVKGPVMDRLLRSHFLDELTGKVFLSQHQAISELSPSKTAAPAA